MKTKGIVLSYNLRVLGSFCQCIRKAMTLTVSRIKNYRIQPKDKRSTCRCAVVAEWLQMILMSLER